MKINRLEDLIVWREARILRKMVYDITSKYPPEEKYIIVKHMKECSRNIPGNIGEAFGRFNYQESMQFNRIARGSLMELKSDAYCSLDSMFINQEQFDMLLAQIEKVLALLNGLIRSTGQVKKNAS